jgi:hypothetical protein
MESASAFRSPLSQSLKSIQKVFNGSVYLPFCFCATRVRINKLDNLMATAAAYFFLKRKLLQLAFVPEATTWTLKCDPSSINVL